MRKLSQKMISNQGAHSLNQKGFSLIELLVSMLIITVVVGTAYTLLNSAVRITASETAQVAERHDVRLLLIQVTKDIQEAQEVRLENGYLQFVHESAHGLKEIYYTTEVQAGDAAKKNVIRYADGEAQLFITGIQDFQINALDSKHTSFDVILIAEDNHRMTVTRRVGGTAKTESGGISGIVTDSASTQPIAGALVIASGQGNEYWTITNSDGEYQLGNLLADDSAGVNYTVTVTAEGYQSESRSNLQVFANQVIEGVDFNLVPLPPSLPPQILEFKFLKEDNPSLLMNVGGMINQDEHKIQVHLPFWVQQDPMLSPVITLSASAKSVTPGSGQQHLFVEGVEHVYEVEGLDGSRVEYQVVVSFGHPPDAPGLDGDSAYTYIDGVEHRFTKEDLENRENATIITEGILYIPENYGTIQTPNQEPLNYTAKQGIFIGANIETKAANSDIHLRACQGPIEISGASFETGTGQASITMEAGTYILAEGTRIDSGRSGITLIANEYINLNHAHLRTNGFIQLSARTVADITTTNANLNPSPTRTANNGQGVLCP